MAIADLQKGISITKDPDFIKIANGFIAQAKSLSNK
jgi:hypothetical protein